MKNVSVNISVNIPPVYYNESILKLIEFYIEDGFSSYSALEESDKETISAECIKALGDDAYTVLIESENIPQTLHHLSQYLTSGRKEHAYDLVVTIAKNSTEYFREVMDALFEEISSQRIVSNLKDRGLRPVVDKTNGETTWIR